MRCIWLCLLAIGCTADTAAPSARSLAAVLPAATPSAAAPPAIVRAPTIVDATDPDDASLGAVVHQLALARHAHATVPTTEQELNDAVLVAIEADATDDALAIITRLRGTVHLGDPARTPVLGMGNELYARARRAEIIRGETFGVALAAAFHAAFDPLDDLTAMHASSFLPTIFARIDARDDLEQTLARVHGKALTDADTAELIKRYGRYTIARALVAAMPPLLAVDDARRYDTDPNARIRTRDGQTLSAVVTRPKHATGRQPAILFFTIYTEVAERVPVISAAHGYVGVVAYARGKHGGTGQISPYESEVNDTYDTIDWISKQPWCDGRVAMYGGSYVGYTQWAATKHMHPALATIVPYVAALPGQGLPMENNVFMTVNYGWPFYVANGPVDDNKVYYDPKRWNRLRGKWFVSGRSIRDIDKIDGTPNPWMQRWLQHPSFDAYWQAKAPYGADFANIHIPILTVTGYYDDGQISALRYFLEHTRIDKRADHYVVIGPYDHFGAQRHPAAALRGYTLDPVAVIDTQALTFQWFDHVLRKGPMPEPIRDHVNYEVMGANEWRHAPSLDKLDDETLTLYLADHQLVEHRPGAPASIDQTVDLGDRTTETNSYYPSPIVQPELDAAGGVVFEGAPLDHAMSVDGLLRGELRVTINKRDVDVGVQLYEHRADGTYFALTYHLGRASYARDMTKRHLLTPGKLETIPVERSRMTSKLVAAGSRLVVVVNVNKNAASEVNMGTGKNVEDETAQDAGAPLQVRWWNGSFVRLQVRRAAN